LVQVSTVTDNSHVSNALYTLRVNIYPPFAGLCDCAAGK